MEQINSLDLSNVSDVNKLGEEICVAMCKAISDCNSGTNKTKNIFMIFSEFLQTRFRLSNADGKMEQTSCQDWNLYIKHLPLNLEESVDMGLPKMSKFEEMYQFWKQQAEKANAEKQHRVNIQMHLKQTFPKGIDYGCETLPKPTMQVDILQYIAEKEIPKKEKPIRKTIFDLVDINTNLSDSYNIKDLTSIINTLKTYANLTAREKCIIKQLYVKENRSQFLIDFPFLLEEEVINFAKKCLLDSETDSKPLVEFIKDSIKNEEIKYKLISICHQLFVLSDYNEQLLKRFTMIMDEIN